MSNRRAYLGALATGLSVAVGGCLDSDSPAAAEDVDEATGTDATETGTGAESGTGDGMDEGTDTPLEGMIAITGSSTVYPLAQAVAEGFRRQNPRVNFTLSVTGTGGGFSQQFCEGQSDFNTASRPITDDERQLCADNGVEYHELTLARDAVTVVVNTDNDWADCVTTDELRDIWRAEGATTWSDVTSSWPEEEIQRFGPADTSGTFDYFRDGIIGEDAAHTSEYEPTERDDIIVQAVQQDEYAIGYLGFSYYRANSDAVRALGINDGGGCVEPTLDAAADGDYPLARPLYTYVETDRLGEAHVAEFARYLVEQSADTELVADEVGYVPNTQAQMESELAGLNAAITDAR